MRCDVDAIYRKKYSFANDLLDTMNTCSHASNIVWDDSLLIPMANISTSNSGYNQYFKQVFFVDRHCSMMPNIIYAYVRSSIESSFVGCSSVRLRSVCLKDQWTPR
jgi:hypothetical protein